jgi:hypothetical protein
MEGLEGGGGEKRGGGNEKILKWNKFHGLLHRKETFE